MDTRPLPQWAAVAPTVAGHRATPPDTLFKAAPSGRLIPAANIAIGTQILDHGAHDFGLARRWAPPMRLTLAPNWGEGHLRPVAQSSRRHSSSRRLPETASRGFSSDPWVRLIHEDKPAQPASRGGLARREAAARALGPWRFGRHRWERSGFVIGGRALSVS